MLRGSTSEVSMVDFADNKAFDLDARGLGIAILCCLNKRY
jgi:hypothetical protein